MTLLASGPDEREALRALEEAVDAGLGEEEDEAEAEAEAEASLAELPEWRPAGQAISVPGIAASPGIAIGPVWHLKRRRLVVERTAKVPAVEEAEAPRRHRVRALGAARPLRGGQGEIRRRQGVDLPGA